MKGLVISGGGALGAWGGGVAQALTEKSNEKGEDYQVFVGTSTGSLMMPLVAAKDFENLQKAYTSVNQKSIFNVNPFKKNGSLKFFNTLWRLITWKKTFGESKPLRKLIDEFYTEDIYHQLKGDMKKIICCCANMSTMNSEYFDNFHWSHNDMKDWIWISANAPVFMSLVWKMDAYWCDGGIVDHTPIQKAINEGATDIDVIVHKTQYFNGTDWQPKGILKSIIRIIDILTHNVIKDDLKIGNLAANAEDVTLRIHYMPKQFLSNSLMFDKEKMQQMWTIGYNGTYDESHKYQEVIIKGDKKLKKDEHIK